MPRPHTAYYSIIQFCPDSSRLEVANVGVVLLCPELNYLDAITTESNDRIKRFFDLEIDEKRMRFEKFGIQESLKIDRDDYLSLESLRHFIATRCNRMVMSPLREVFIYEIETPEMILDRLYKRLV